jgi:polyhydroxyalkanoate synthesis regulator phasin
MDLRKTTRMAQGAPTAEADATTLTTTTEVLTDAEVAPQEPLDWQIPADLSEAMRAEALQVKLDVRSTNAPVIGALMRRVRTTLHNLASFYVYKLAGKQVSVNATFGDWIVRLIQTYKHQQKQIDALNEEVDSLRSRLAEKPES